jgi:hypothetical protein
MARYCMVDKRIISEWLSKADEDYGFASSVIEDSEYYAQLCFHFQQAAGAIGVAVKELLIN